MRIESKIAVHDGDLTSTLYAYLYRISFKKKMSQRNNSLLVSLIDDLRISHLVLVTCLADLLQ